MITPSLATISSIVGVILIIMALPAVLIPISWRMLLERFPRNTTAAALLTAVDLTWIALIVFNAHLGRFEVYKPALYLVTPAAFFLLLKFLDELLAPRALGGFLLLAANPILNAARWHDSEARLVMTSLAYVFVIVGTILVLSPYRFRLWLLFWHANPTRARIGGLLGLALGVLVIILGLRVY
jgi:hypothetical protein